MDFTNGEFAENQARVNSLLTAAQRLLAEGQGAPNPAADVLRAAVVFLHSSLEEVVRNLFLYRLPNASIDNLNKIPFAGQGGSGRPEKITLGYLRPFEGQLVENVIRESIVAYTETFNLNSSSQLATCLDMAGVIPQRIDRHFASLNEMMRRRHQIVHQMDRANELDPLTDPVTAIDVRTVATWKAAVEDFAADLMALVD